MMRNAGTPGGSFDVHARDAVDEPREPYETPMVRFVEISIQESLMGICKGGVGPATASPVCSTCYGVGS
jgi:hypothetical protein